ncbi:IDEAL domain-containing protein [Pseudalkalibacillus decolorationis]|uniref:IDEAL domain-containing protein n=1 Tax=Pseudalkalibacillus decolorationis TaxID=163879 RepID=UPI0021489134|nr:IDEAL domain-containing protein [Pseudalkalibacillus decolorationis]
MFGHLIAVKTFEHQIDCFCPGGDHANFLTINKGDIIEVTNERKFTMANGWYFLVGINDLCIFYIALEDLEQYFMKERLLSVLEIDLKINYFQFKINETLDTGDEASFLSYTNKLIESSELQVKLENYLNNEAVNHTT